MYDILFLEKNILTNLISFSLSSYLTNLISFSLSSYFFFFSCFTLYLSFLLCFFSLLFFSVFSLFQFWFRKQFRVFQAISYATGVRASNECISMCTRVPSSFFRCACILDQCTAISIHMASILGGLFWQASNRLDTWQDVIFAKRTSSTYTVVVFKRIVT